MSEYPYYFGIASYNRPDRQPLLKLLVDAGYPKGQIIISTQTKENYRDYAERYGNVATVIYREANNISGNKNTILEYASEKLGASKVVMCADKLRGIINVDANKGKHFITTKGELDYVVTMAYALCEQIGALIWGVSSCLNHFFARQSMATNLLMLGCFMGMTDARTQRFDEEQLLKEDFEIILRTVANGGKTLRMNHIVLHETLHTKGGCHELWNSKGDEVNKQSNDRLLSMYPKLVRAHRTRKNEIAYMGPSEVIKKTIFEV